LVASARVVTEGSGGGGGEHVFADPVEVLGGVDGGWRRVVAGSLGW
jgi:hypothetical protein